MRRFLLTLTIISFSGWSQPAQQHAQPPIVVKVEMPPAPTKGALDYLQELGPLIAALVAVGVAVMQYYLQKQQWKQSLYDKRYAVFRSVAHYWRELVSSNGVPSLSAKQRFFDHISHARFLFSADVVNFLEEYYAVTEKYCLESGRLRLEHGLTLPVADLRNEVEAVRKEVDRLAGLKNDEVFAPYLQLHHEQGWLARFIARANRWVDEAPDRMASRYES
jgi:hypothetical protein